MKYLTNILTRPDIQSSYLIINYIIIVLSILTLTSCAVPQYMLYEGDKLPHYNVSILECDMYSPVRLLSVDGKKPPQGKYFGDVRQLAGGYFFNGFKIELLPGQHKLMLDYYERGYGWAMYSKESQALELFSEKGHHYTIEIYFRPIPNSKSRKSDIPYDWGAKVVDWGYFGGEAGKKNEILRVSSVPIAADVYINELGGDIKLNELQSRLSEYDMLSVGPDFLGNYKGKTPILIPIRPGNYQVFVLIPENQITYENDGEIFIKLRKGEGTIKKGWAYLVEIKEYKQESIIALFQPIDEDLASFLTYLPEGHNYQFNNKELQDNLLDSGVLDLDIPNILEILHRGGKIILKTNKNKIKVEISENNVGEIKTIH